MKFIGRYPCSSFEYLQDRLFLKMYQSAHKTLHRECIFVLKCCLILQLYLHNVCLVNKTTLWRILHIWYVKGRGESEYPVLSLAPSSHSFHNWFQGQNAHFLHSLPSTPREGHTQFLPVLIPFRMVYVVLGFLVSVSLGLQFLFAISP